MAEEFGNDKFPANDMHIMETDRIDENHAEYFLDIEVPYGSYNVAIFSKEIDKEGEQKGGETGELQSLPDLYLPYFRNKCVPQPISREQQRELDDKEEKENKEKEREARQA